MASQNSRFKLPGVELSLLGCRNSRTLLSYNISELKPSELVAPRFCGACKVLGLETTRRWLETSIAKHAQMSKTTESRVQDALSQLVDRILVSNPGEDEDLADQRYCQALDRAKEVIDR